GVRQIAIQEGGEAPLVHATRTGPAVQFQGSVYLSQRRVAAHRFAARAGIGDVPGEAGERDAGQRLVLDGDRITRQ
ncbi:MAG TPA: hypothetical protein VJ883_07555, partial [Woeseiaceae bacterium]|nr:hypothetical protein [Woeseiaceae bacterium]